MDTSSINASGGDGCVKLSWAAVCREEFDERPRKGWVKVRVSSVILCEAMPRRTPSNCTITPLKMSCIR